MLRASLVLVLFTTACTTTEPDTSPGVLTRVLDQAFICDDAASDASWACSIELTLAGTRLKSVGIHNDGSTNGPASVATLSQTAVDELDALIATVPMSVDGVDGGGCGVGPSAARAGRLALVTGGVGVVVCQAGEGGALREGR
jgi:hypothetical protein